MLTKFVLIIILYSLSTILAHKSVFDSEQFVIFEKYKQYSKTTGVLIMLFFIFMQLTIMSFMFLFIEGFLMKGLVMGILHGIFCNYLIKTCKIQQIASEFPSYSGNVCSLNSDPDDKHLWQIGVGVLSTMVLVLTILVAGLASSLPLIAIFGAIPMAAIGLSIPLLIVVYYGHKYPYGIGTEDSKYTDSKPDDKTRINIETADKELTNIIKYAYAVILIITVIVGIWKMFIL